MRAIDGSIELAQRKVSGSTLYASIEPCLLCLAMAYWAGIRRVVYGIRRSEVDSSYYKSEFSATELSPRLHESIELINLSQLENQTIDVVRAWEKTPMGFQLATTETRSRRRMLACAIYNDLTDEPKWRARRDSNPRPFDPKSNALSTELRARVRRGRCARQHERTKSTI